MHATVFQHCHVAVLCLALHTGAFHVWGDSFNRLHQKLVPVSCVCTIGSAHSFMPVRHPAPFITKQLEPVRFCVFTKLFTKKRKKKMTVKHISTQMYPPGNVSNYRRCSGKQQIKWVLMWCFLQRRAFQRQWTLCVATQVSWWWATAPATPTSST